MSKTVKIAIGAAVAVLVLGVAGFFLFVKSDPAPKFDVATTADKVDSSGSVADSTGNWTVTDGSQAGFRIDEDLTVGHNTATARTTGVTGTLTLDDATITAAKVTVDLTGLTSTDGNGFRDGRVQDALETGTMPDATFELTAPIELGTLPAEGKTIKATATGDFTLHGVTKSIDVTLEAQLKGDNIIVTGSAPVALADYQIDKPSSPRVVSIEDAGEFEVSLIFAQG